MRCSSRTTGRPAGGPQHARGARLRGRRGRERRRGPALRGRELEAAAGAFVDWGLPDAEGVDLIREWRAQPRMHRCALVMLTIRAQIEAINEALEAGADEFVMKPCTVEVWRPSSSCSTSPSSIAARSGPWARGTCLRGGC
nr:response regulator [Pseudenhygromyxa sp. WMMC2535]